MSERIASLGGMREVEETSFLLYCRAPFYGVHKHALPVKRLWRSLWSLPISSLVRLQTLYADDG